LTREAAARYTQAKLWEIVITQQWDTAPPGHEERATVI
jgi:hypothetical protein